MNTNKWEIFSDPNLPLRFKYPTPTPKGRSVNWNIIDGDKCYRVHLTARDSPEDNDPEIYFEIGRYDGVSSEQVYCKLRMSEEQRNSEVIVSQVKEIILDSWPGIRFAMTWPEKTREVLIVSGGDSVFRIIYDPKGNINKQILSTVTFTFL